MLAKPGGTSGLGALLREGTEGLLELGNVGVLLTPSLLIGSSFSSLDSPSSSVKSKSFFRKSGFNFCLSWNVF